MRKTRRTYVQPTSEVVELHVTNQLLQASASGGLDSPSDYEYDSTDPTQGGGDNTGGGTTNPDPDGGSDSDE